MKVNLVIQPGNVCEVQLPEGETLISGGVEVAKLFARFKSDGPGHGEHDWRFIPYDLDPYDAPGVLGVALQREARAAASRR
jgi:hypothetical protein